MTTSEQSVYEEEPYEERVRNHTVSVPSGCLEWQGATARGYAKLWIGGRLRSVHRWVWENAFGEIPSTKLVVMHTCDNRKCVRSDHLRLGTQGDNLRDMYAKGRGVKHQALKTHCPHGHEYTPENTGIWKGHRDCRTCRRKRDKERQRRRSALTTHCAKGHLLAGPAGRNDGLYRSCPICPWGARRRQA